MKESKSNDFIEFNYTDASKCHSCYIHDNELKYIVFGGDEYGINGATPPELLHVFRQGVCDISPEEFYGLFKYTTLQWSNSMCNKLSIHSLHQSDRDITHASVPKVITSLEKITDDEKMGLFLALFLVMFTTSGMKTIPIQNFHHIINYSTIYCI